MYPLLLVTEFLVTLYKGQGSNQSHLSRWECDISKPLIKAQVTVCELFQKSPLNDAFRCLVLEEVNQDVLQTSVLLWRRLLQGELVQAWVLLVESLEEAEEVSSHKSLDFYNFLKLYFLLDFSSLIVKWSDDLHKCYHSMFNASDTLITFIGDLLKLIPFPVCEC